MDFMDHWNCFLKDGVFNKDIFISRDTFYPIRNYSNPVKVLFLQGLQGSGKTTIAKYLCDNLENTTYIEQDMFSGDTNICLGALYHLISSANGPKIIIVSRCNINITHYRRYLDMCHHLPTIVGFLAPEMFAPLYLMISLAGIFERTIRETGDVDTIKCQSDTAALHDIDKLVELSIGKSKVSIKDVISFLLGNYSIYQIHSNAIVYNTYTKDIGMLNTCKNIYRSGTSELVKFVKNNYKRLLELRHPVEVICKPIIDLLNTDNVIPNKHIVVPSNPSYIGAYIKDNDRLKLLEILNSHSSTYDSTNSTTHVHYMLQIYIGGKMPRQLQLTPYMPGEVIKRDICALVIRKTDGASGFRIAPLPGEKSSFHVPCRIPNGQKASCIKTFVGCNDSKIVELIEMRYTLEMIGFWKI